MKAQRIIIKSNASIILLISRAVLVCACLFFPAHVAADANATGIAYPQMREPYRTVFNSIMEGVRQEAPSPVKAFEIVKGEELEKISSWVDKNNIGVLVSLGKQGLEACKDLPIGIRMIAGAVLSPAAGNGCQLYGGIAMAPSPDRLFAQLKTLKPSVANVIVVYNATLNDWLITHAKQAASKHSLKMDAIAVNNLKEAAKTYRELIDKGLGPEHAIWLPQDPHTVDQKTVLPVLLKESWNKEFIVFSSNPAHVKRGVLFALYPDYQAMGKSLGRMASRASNSAVKKTPIQPLNDLLIAVNLRTADHLKLNLSNSMKGTFDLTFPASR